jgi:hypothetical protein
MIVAACASVIAVAMAQADGNVQSRRDRLPWSSTFDSGHLGEWDEFRNTTGAAISDDGCVAGRCLRTPLVSGTANDNYGDFHFADFVNVRGSKVEEIWLRVWSKFDGGISWPNRGQKIAILNLTDGSSWTRHYQVYVYVDPRGYYAVDHSNLREWQFHGLPQNVGEAAPVRLDQWDKLKLHVRLNSPGRADGVVRLWVNDELKAYHQDLNIREGTSYGINKLNLSTYATQASPSDGTQWHDEIALATVDPDTLAQRPPNPPRNLRIIR